LFLCPVSFLDAGFLMFMFLLAGRITAQKSPAKYLLLAGLFIFAKIQNLITLLFY